jgi:hypothetical protein
MAHNTRNRFLPHVFPFTFFVLCDLCVSIPPSAGFVQHFSGTIHQTKEATMLASNQLPVNSTIFTAKTASTRPAWVNRLLGVRPAPIVEEHERDVPQVYPAVEGVTTASAFRCYPR